MGKKNQEISDVITPAEPAKVIKFRQDSDELLKSRDDGDDSQERGGTGGGDDGMNERIARLDAILLTLATKADISEVKAGVSEAKADIIKWAAGIAFAIVAIIISVLAFLINRAAPTQSAAQQPIIINVPQQTPSAAQPMKPNVAAPADNKAKK